MIRMKMTGSPSNKVIEEAIAADQGKPGNYPVEFRGSDWTVIDPSFMRTGLIYNAAGLGRRIEAWKDSEDVIHVKCTKETQS